MVASKLQTISIKSVWFSQQFKFLKLPSSAIIEHLQIRFIKKIFNFMLLINKAFNSISVPIFNNKFTELRIPLGFAHLILLIVHYSSFTLPPKLSLDAFISNFFNVLYSVQFFLIYTFVRYSNFREKWIYISYHTLMTLSYIAIITAMPRVSIR